jgi:hypothetical protein
MKKIALAAGALLATTSIYAIAQEAPAPSREGGFGLGREALPEEIAAWDIDIRPDGLGLPVGQGDVWTGEELSSPTAPPVTAISARRWAAGRFCPAASARWTARIR